MSAGRDRKRSFVGFSSWQGSFTTRTNAKQVAGPACLPATDHRPGDVLSNHRGILRSVSFVCLQGYHRWGRTAPPETFSDFHVQLLDVDTGDIARVAALLCSWQLHAQDVRLDNRIIDLRTASLECMMGSLKRVGPIFQNHDAFGSRNFAHKKTKK